jgi:hypothetical protein
MLIIGCDYHPSFQQIAFVETETGELGEQRLIHPEEAERFYGKLKEESVQVRVGMEASGHARWRSLMSARRCALKTCLTQPTLLEIAIYQQLGSASPEQF